MLWISVENILRVDASAPGGLLLHLVWGGDGPRQPDTGVRSLDTPAGTRHEEIEDTCLEARVLELQTNVHIITENAPARLY